MHSKLVSAYHAHGYVVAESLVGAEECEQLIAEAHRVASEAATKMAPLMQVHRQSKLFLSFLKDVRFVEICQALIEGPVSALQCHFYFAPAGQPGFILHQDNFCIEGPPGSVVSFWIPFVDVNRHNGGLYTFEASHKRGLIPVTDIPPERVHPLYPNMNKETDRSQLGQPIDLALHKGDALILHGENVHGSYDNASSQCRYSAVLTYVRRNAPFRPGFTAKREEIEV